jgi:hypothetical protein
MLLILVEGLTGCKRASQSSGDFRKISWGPLRLTVTSFTPSANRLPSARIAGIPYRGSYVFEKPFRVLVTVKAPSRRTVTLISFPSHGSCRLAMKSAGAFFRPPASE